MLWCYEQVEALWERGELGVCLDEKPNIQALQRAVYPLQSGRIERQEFEYERHGTVNLLVGLMVHNGQMVATCLEHNDAEHFGAAREPWRRQGEWAKRIHLILDNGLSHIARKTRNFFRGFQDWVRVLYTPVHASWLSQAELLLRVFAGYYLERGSWESCEALQGHLLRGVGEYNERWAHPFEWSWTRRKLRDWVANKAPPIPCKTSSTLH